MTNEESLKKVKQKLSGSGLHDGEDYKVIAVEQLHNTDKYVVGCQFFSNDKIVAYLVSDNMVLPLPGEQA